MQQVTQMSHFQWIRMSKSKIIFNKTEEGSVKFACPPETKYITMVFDKHNSLKEMIVEYGNGFYEFETIYEQPDR